MTEAEKTAKPKVGKAPAAKKEAAPKAAEKKAPVAAPAAKKTEKKAAKTGARVRVTQVRGTIARKHDQQATLIGLGLNKRHRVRELEDTPEVRGMIYKVRHLVTVEQA